MENFGSDFDALFLLIIGLSESKFGAQSVRHLEPLG